MDNNPPQPPIAFLSYSHVDDDHHKGFLSQFRERLSGEVQVQTGDPFDIFWDRNMRWGEEWAARIEQTIRSVTFFLPVLTPSFFRSEYCRRELEAFLAHEQRLGRSDLILPLYLVHCDQLHDSNLLAADPLAMTVAARQYADWRKQRHYGLSTPTGKRRVADLARQICVALYRNVSVSQPSPDTIPKSEAQMPLSASARTGRPTPKSSRLAEEHPPRVSTSPEGIWSYRPEPAFKSRIDEPGGRAERVLILTEDESLGAQCKRILRAHGVECTQSTVNEEFSPEALLASIIQKGQEVVLCEFRMSSYTALNLLRDLSAASLSSRVHVATLGFDHHNLGEFYRLGGAAHITLNPGERQDEAFKEMLLKVEAHRRQIDKHRSEVIAYLRSLKDEKVFRRFAVELFRHLNYREVRMVHGTDEADKALVFYEQNRMGVLEYVGVQVKIGDIHGDVSRPENATALLLQTVEALNSPIYHLGKSHYLDKHVILASGMISEPARGKIEEFLRHNKYDKRVYFWGQEEIADVKVQYAPSFIRFPS